MKQDVQQMIRPTKKIHFSIFFHPQFRAPDISGCVNLPCCKEILLNPIHQLLGDLSSVETEHLVARQLILEKNGLLTRK